MRLIDADALTKAIKRDADDNVLTERYVFYRINEAPTINIVRCKECKYEPICNHSVQHTTHEPTSVTIGYKLVEWCSYGEREGE